MYRITIRHVVIYAIAIATIIYIFIFKYLPNGVHFKYSIRSSDTDKAVTKSDNEPKIELYETIKNRTMVIHYLKRRLEEALKEEKGSGCTIPRLDPFAKEVTQFDYKRPKVICHGHDWVRCHLSECRLTAQILERVQDITCVYRDILYHTDHKRSLGPSTLVFGPEIYTLINSDHVKVNCTGRKGDKKTSWSGHTLGFRKLTVPPSPAGRKNSLNVLLIGFDSTSKNGFIRRMPKSYKLLTKEMGAIVMNGYNIVGDGTSAALFPILTGHEELELPDVRKKMKNKRYLDDFPFIFKYVKEDGYRTAYFEDTPWGGSFQWRFNGFLKQPADHYLRAFLLEEYNVKNPKYCIGDRPQYYMLLNITKQFFKQDSKKFCFTFIADISHDDFSRISTADEDFATFFKQFKRDGHMEDTIIFVMGDHGSRYSKMRATLQGKQEERLPLMAILLPPKIRETNPHWISNLKKNAEILSTPFDIHATYLDAIGLYQYRNNFQVTGSEWPRSLSLFSPLPVNRTCSDAGIQRHWCTCIKWTKVPQHEPVYRRAADALVDFINNVTQEQRSKCAVRSLISIDWVMRQSVNNKILTFKISRDADGFIGDFGNNTKILTEYYQARIAVSPGYGVYEASMIYLPGKGQFQITTRDISRINAYGSEPSCISATHAHLNMYCYCIIPETTSKHNPDNHL